MRLAVLIVNWNAGPLLARCLEALGRQERPADRIVVVDNASTDSSIEQAQPYLQRADVIRLKTNRGFAAGNNVAAAAAEDCELLALLNPDAFAAPDWLAALEDAAVRRPDFAAFASQMRLDSRPEHLDGAGDTYHVSGRAWRIAHGHPAHTVGPNEVEVFAPCAAAALYRRDAFDDVGGFDERFFCYFEDVDLGFRLRLRGHRSLYVPSAVVRHVSSALSGYRSHFSVYHGERNAVWTFIKNMPGGLLWRYLPQHVLLNLAALAFYPWRGQGRTVWRAKRDALRALPSVLSDRRQIQQGRRVDAATLRRAMTRGVFRPYRPRYHADAPSPEGAPGLPRRFR